MIIVLVIVIINYLFTSKTIHVHAVVIPTERKRVNLPFLFVYVNCWKHCTHFNFNSTLIAALLYFWYKSTCSCNFYYVHACVPGLAKSIV